MFTTSQIIGFRARIILVAMLIFLVLSCAGCATLAAITEFAKSDDVQNALIISQPAALMIGK